MPRYLLVKPAKGTSVPHPHADRRYVGKPNATTPIWAAGEEPNAEVVLDDPALRKAARGPDLAILGSTVADNLEAARAALQPPAKPGKDK
jgi:hypothetical protein